VLETLNLVAGEWVEVRSAGEILATLDAQGCLDRLPFMPEMLPYCGRRFRVHKRAHKTCDTIGPWTLRRMLNTVHLALLRCNGGAHGGCQSGCLFFWKEAWLKRVADGGAAQHTPPDRASTGTAADVVPIADLHQLQLTTRRDSQSCDLASDASEGPVHYRCQSTELQRASDPLRWWEPTQYWRDMRANGVSLWQIVCGLSHSIWNRVLKALKQPTYPRASGRLTRTPAEELNLQPGELVEVKSQQEILATLDRRGKNRGMMFDAEMVPYCGKQFRVLRRVEQIIDERSGLLVRLPNPSIILNDVICTARYHRFCPRSSYSFWREIWLRRVEEPSISSVSRAEQLDLAIAAGALDERIAYEREPVADVESNGSAAAIR
jgi:hypothetical protein